MSRNAESRFSMLPQVSIGRSKFNRDSSVKTSFNVGDVIPFYVDEVLPGDTMSVKTSKVVRLQTMLTPMMDNVYLDTYWYFVPNRLVWQHWREFCGENTQSAWAQQIEYEIPQLEAPSGGWNAGTIADYMGIPIGVDGISVNALPIRAYALIMQEWFRDENLSDPLVIPVSDSTVTGVNSGNYITDVAKGGLPFKAAKYHDYFTSALPAPQKGPDVMIPVAAAGDLEVHAKATPFSVTDDVPMSFKGKGETVTYSLQGSSTDQASSVGTLVLPSSSIRQLIPNNLYAVSDGNATAATINQLRMAFQIQRLYEKDARGGTRYIEILKSHFGVTSPDARLQRPEYLGGNRIPLSVNQVLQQSETASTPQGTPTGLSFTTDVHGDFSKSFVEHGYLIGLMVARYDHTYQQGIERFWRRKGRFDFYWPTLANIGEQGIYNSEIYVQGSSAVNPDTGNAYDDEIFGYQEAWADYRYKPNRVSSEMRSDYAQSLDVWHLADDYASLPSLSDSWIREDKANVDRVLAVTSAVSNQVFADIFIQNSSVRPMPVYSVPGLIDHN